MAERAMIGFTSGVSGLGSASTTYYFTLGAYADLANTTELNAQRKMGFAGRFQKLYVRSPINGQDSDMIVTLRKNGADTALTATITTDSELLFTDLSNVVSFTADDLICIAVQVTGTAGGARLVLTVEIETDGQISTLQSSLGSLTSSVQRTIGFSGSVGNGNDQGLTGTVAMESATISRVQLAIATGPSTGSTTFTFVKANVDQTISVSLPNGAAAGLYEATGTDTVAANDNYTGRGGGGVGNIAYRGAAVTYTGAVANRTPNVCGRSVNTLGVGQTRYGGLWGQSLDSTTEANVASLVSTPGTLSRLTVDVRTNPSTVDTVARSRVNGANGNQVVTIPALGTAVYSDTTNSDVVAAGNTAGHMVGNTQDGIIDITSIGMLFTAEAQATATGHKNLPLLGVG